MKAARKKAQADARAVKQIQATVRFNEYMRRVASHYTFMLVRHRKNPRLRRLVSIRKKSGSDLLKLS